MENNDLMSYQKELIKSTLQSSNSSIEDFYKKYKALKKAEMEYNAVMEELKPRLLEIYKQDKELSKTCTVGNLKFTYVAPTVRTGIDSKKLQEEEPEIYKKFIKTTNVSGSIRIEG